MSTSSTEGQAPQDNGNTGGEGQAPTANQDQGQAPEGQEGTPPDFDLSKITDPAVKAWAEAMEHEKREARAEAARYRTERNAEREARQKIVQENETAEQKAQREQTERDEKYARLERENRDLKIGQTVREKASTAFNPDTVYRMIQDRIETDDTGKPTNVDTLLKDLRKSDPYLFKRDTADAGEGRGGDGTKPLTMNDAIRQAAGH